MKTNALQEYLFDNNAHKLTNNQIIELMAKKHIDVHISYIDFMPYMLFKYGINADFNDPIVKCARGVILDGCSFDVVCAPFDKFGNYNEPYVDDIDWASAKVQEKYDGSLIKLWFCDYSKRWIWSTNGTILAHDAPHNVYGDFYYAITSSVNFRQIKYAIDHDKLDKTYTYIFEFISPDNQIVIKYPEPKLIHIGTRSNITLQEKEVNLGIQKPYEYPIHNLNDAINYANKICTPESRHEGFVVVDKNYHRVKVKNAFYLQAHYLMGKINNPEKICEIIDNGDMGEIVAYLPEFKDLFDSYKIAHEMFCKEIKDFLYDCEKYNRENSNNRKEYALAIKDLKYASYGFKLYDSGMTVDEFLLKNPITYRDMYKANKEILEELTETINRAFLINEEEKTSEEYEL